METADFWLAETTATMRRLNSPVRTAYLSEPTTVPSTPYLYKTILVIMLDYGNG